ncbi:MAG TPA: restriction endonuclease subunit S [Candidatus Companilactobacillus pullicola]|uniref:Restriction endonuclease subunit S n=1 Tax=Candidatus Companilactobacillus pullicola TaxID=2838523 RepID=A0A9D1ZN62_9LACO|nr:restriction endonuclease subunit S [Candidatus Companilactobacillus pullicola]
MKYRLGDLLYIKGRIGWKGLKKKEYLDKGDYRIINGTNIINGKVNWSSCGFISKERYNESPEIMLKANDILITKDGTIGKVAIVEELSKPSTVASGIFILRNTSPNIWITKYLYYYLQSYDFKSFIHSRIEGSVIPHLYQKDFESLSIKSPSLEEQNTISRRLELIDKKIDLNNQLNDNLLDFLDTEFSHQFLGERNFPSGKVKDFVNIKRGASPRPIKDFLSENGRSWVKISDVTKLTTPFLYRTEQYIKESGIKKSRTIKPGTLILSNSATPGIPVISEILASVHDGWLIIDNYSLMDRNWFYLFFRQMRNSLVAQANGSVFNNLKTNIVKEFPVPIVDKSELTKFHKISNPIFEKLNQIQQENIELNRIKQTLLSQYF